MGILCPDMIENRPFMIMENMIVDKNWQGKGVGKLLLKKIETIACENNCLFIQFCSSMFRKGAHNFYYRAGYSPDEVKGFRKWL